MATPPPCRPHATAGAVRRNAGLCSRKIAFPARGFVHSGQGDSSGRKTAPRMNRGGKSKNRRVRNDFRPKNAPRPTDARELRPIRRRGRSPIPDRVLLPVDHGCGNGKIRRRNAHLSFVRTIEAMRAEPAEALAPSSLSHPNPIDSARGGSGQALCFGVERSVIRPIRCCA